MDVLTTMITVEPGVDLATDIADGGPPGFLLVHGLASNARLYDGVARRLVDAGHAVAAIDLRGHGRSSAPEHGYDIERLRDDLVEVLAALSALDPTSFAAPIAVGQSLGGNLVLELAAVVPERLAGVVGIDGGTIELADAFPTAEAAVTALTPPRFGSVRQSQLAAVLRNRHPGWPAQAIEATLSNFTVHDDGTVTPHLRLDHHLSLVESLFAHRPSRLYRTLAVPVLLLAAAASEDDPATAVKRSAIDRAVAEIATAEATWFIPADHDVHAQHPGAVTNAILEALARGLFR
jgi:pimeloyl-ACP methyl ester carboxylesterase